MNRTEALRIAQNAVCDPIRYSSSSYILYGPYHDDDPTGPTTELNCDSYRKALQRRTEWVASIVLNLLGADGGMVDEIVNRHGPMSAAKLVRYAMAKEN